MKKIVIIEIGVETEVPEDRLESLLQPFVENHSFITRLHVPVVVATSQKMDVENVKVTVKKSL